jgi:hypothetical protein
VVVVKFTVSAKQRKVVPHHNILIGARDREVLNHDLISAFVLETYHSVEKRHKSLFGMWKDDDLSGYCYCLGPMYDCVHGATSYRSFSFKQSDCGILISVAQPTYRSSGPRERALFGLFSVSGVLCSGVRFVFLV